METLSPKTQINVPLRLILISLCTIIGILATQNNLYLGEELTDKTIVQSSKPEHIQRHKRRDYYGFKDHQYPCTFIISGGGYAMVKKYEQIRHLLEEMNDGDTIKVSIRQRDEHEIYDASAHVEIIGLKYNTIQLISPKEVEKEDRKRFYMIIAIFAILFIAGVGALFYNKIFPRQN